MEYGKCELCGRTESEETKSDYLRIVNIGNNNKLWRGYFKPHLTEIEFYLLGKDEHTICSNRRNCYKRREKRKTYEISYGHSVYYKYQWLPEYFRKRIVKGKTKALKILRRLNRFRQVDFTDIKEI